MKNQRLVSSLLGIVGVAAETFTLAAVGRLALREVLQHVHFFQRAVPGDILPELPAATLRGLRVDVMIEARIRRAARRAGANWRPCMSASLFAWIKAFHIIFMVCWFAGIFYLLENKGAVARVTNDLGTTIYTIDRWE